MSQLIACKTHEGITLGADGKAVDVDDNGNLIELKIERLHQLSECAAILTGGATAGEEMCEALKRFVAEENLNTIDQIYKAALPFLATEYERFMRRICQIQPIDPIHQIVFILGGYTHTDSDNPFRLYLMWTRKKLPLLDSDEIDLAFTVPRIIKLEHQLSQLANKRAELDEVITAIRHGMEKQAELDEEVSEPLSYAMITSDGFKRF